MAGGICVDNEEGSWLADRLRQHPCSKGQRSTSHRLDGRHGEVQTDLLGSSVWPIWRFEGFRELKPQPA